MLRPLPVVDVAAEGSGRHRRRRHEAYVAVYLIESHVILGSAPHDGEPWLQACFVPVFALHHEAKLPASGRLAGRLIIGFHLFHFLCDINNPFEEVDGLVLDVDLFI